MHFYEKFKSSQAFGFVLIALAVANWSGNFVVARGLSDFPPATLNLIRWIIAAVVLFPFGIKPLIREWHAVRPLLLELFLLALVGISLFDVAIFKAGHTTEALNMSLLSCMSPFLTAIVARIFLGEECSAKMMAGIFVSAIGICVLVTDGDLMRLATMKFATGDLLMLAVAFMSAIYNVMVKRVSGKISQITLLMVTFIFGVLTLIPMWMWETREAVVMPEFTPNVLWALAYLGVIASVFCYLWWNMAVEIIGASKTTLFYYAIPFCSGVQAWIFLGETVSAMQFVAGGIIFSGIILSLMPSRRRAETAVASGGA